MTEQAQAAPALQDQFHFRSPVPGGPGILRWFACEHGPSGHCSAGKHDRCAHRWGGPQYGGVKIPETDILRRDGTVVSGAPVLPIHVWRCTCSCHTEDGATDLLGFIR